MRNNQPINDQETEVPQGQMLVSRTAPDSTIVFANEAFVQVSGFAEADLVGQPHNIVRHPHMPPAAFADLWATLKSGQPWDGLVKNRTRDGGFYWVRANVTPMIEDSRTTGYISIRTRPSRDEIRQAEAAYAAIAAGTGRLALHQGDLRRTGVWAALGSAATSIAGRIALGFALLIGAMITLGAIAYAGIVDGADPHTLLAVTAGILGASVVGALGLGAWLLATLRHPLRLLEAELSAIAHGTSRGAIALPAAREFHTAFRQLRAMRAKLTYAVLERGEQERQATADRSRAIHAMADTVESETRAAVANIADRTTRMASEARAMNESANRVSANAVSVAAAAEQALANAQAVGAASEQLTASIHEIAAQVAQASAVAGRAVEGGERAQQRIGSLSDSASRIGDVVQMISSIAGQTNLLALNATIEAARAGDAGKGFAVVASEVKNLATQTARSTDEIARQIAEIQATTSAVVEAVGDIGSRIHELAQVSVAVAAAVEQQAAATQEISRNVTQAGAAAQEVAQRIAEVSAEATRAGDQALHVQKGTGEIADTIGALGGVIVEMIHTTTQDIDRRAPAHQAAA